MTTEPESIPSWPFERVDPLSPPPELAVLREKCPMSKVSLWDGQEVWLATRYEDIKALLRSPDISSDTSRPNFPQASATLAAARGSQKTFVRTDPPEHGVQRRMLIADFTPAQVATLRPYMEALVDGLLNNLEATGGPVDLVTALATPVPAHVICKILGLPPERSDFFLDRVSAFMNLDGSPSDAYQANSDVTDYFTTVVAERMKSPGDDLISKLITENVASGKLTVEQLVPMLNLLLVGGFDTTANMIALGTIVLLRNPAQLEDLRANPDLIVNAVEEMIRYLTVAHHVAFRQAKGKVEVGGVCIHAGEGVAAPIAAANRDPEAFPDPDRFDIRRDARDHVAFGFGPHQCIGQHLARLELQVVFSKLIERLPALRFAGDPDELNYRNSMIYGVEALPVTW
jgi:hypothetical protein